MLICILRNKEGRVSYTHTQIHILQHDWALAVFEQSIWIRGAKERGEKTRVNQNVVKWRKQKNTKHQNKTQNRYWQNDLSFRKKFFECILRLRTGSIVSPTRERVQSRGLCIEVKAYIAVHCDLNHIHRFVCVRLVGQHIFCLYIFAWKKVFSPNIFYFFFPFYSVSGNTNATEFHDLLARVIFVNKCTFLPYIVFEFAVSSVLSFVAPINAVDTLSSHNSHFPFNIDFFSVCILHSKKNTQNDCKGMWYWFECIHLSFFLSPFLHSILFKF